MPAVARDGDPTTTGHGCDSNTTITGPTGASVKVYVNGIAVECKGNPTVNHAYGGRNCSARHTAAINRGSGSVNVGGIPIARVGDSTDGGSISAGSPNVFAGDASAGTPIVVFGDTAFVANTQQLTSNYLSNPSSYYNTSAQADGVKANYPGTADDTSEDPGYVNQGSFSDIIPFLQQILIEASQGRWRETGQSGKPSNSKITGIWGALGFPGATSSPWNTDQTAWCMGFVNYALKSSSYKWVPTASAAAITQNPGRWGAVQVPKEQAQPGDIAFWSYRHVNFVYEKKGSNFTFVGGNQTPKGGSNNPDDGDVTISYPGGTAPTNANWVSCWRPSKG